MIDFLCSSCGAQLKVRDEQTGKAGKCPACGKHVRAPGTPAATQAVSTTKIKKRHATRVPGDPASDSSVNPEETAALSSDAGQCAGDSNVVFQPESAFSEEDYAFLNPPQAPDEIGRLGQYRVLKVLGVGGMGVVFQAEDMQLKRLVALKAMKPAIASKEMNRKRFFREAQTTAAIEHDNIVSIYQVGEDKGVPFLAMKLLQGESLDDRLKREGGWMALPDVLRIGREICEGLAAAHERKLVHRDIKPANIWLEAPRDRVKIVDFGLARVATEDGKLTQTGTLMGTPAYMAPEQASGQEVDHRCDLFSVGCVLYRMSTGQLPFRGKDTMSMLMSLATQQPEPPRKIDPGLPQTFSDLILHLLEKDPDERFSSAREVANAIAQIEQDATGTTSLSARKDTATVERMGKKQSKTTPTAARADKAKEEAPKSRHKEAPVRAVAADPEEIEELDEDEPGARDRQTGGRPGTRKRKNRKGKDGERDAEGNTERKLIILGIVVGVVIVGLVLYLLVVKPMIHASKDAARTATSMSEPV